MRQARRQSKEKPRLRTHYLKGSLFCGGCGEALSMEVSRNRTGNLYSYFYCLGRQARKNGCQFKAIQAHVVEDLVENYWATVSLTPARAEDIRTLVRDHLDKVSPQQNAERDKATAHLEGLDRESDKAVAGALRRCDPAGDPQA